MLDSIIYGVYFICSMVLNAGVWLIIALFSSMSLSGVIKPKNRLVIKEIYTTIEEPSDDCWIVYEFWKPNDYRCINCETVQEAANSYAYEFGPESSYMLYAFLHRSYDDEKLRRNFPGWLVAIKKQDVVNMRAIMNVMDS